MMYIVKYSTGSYSDYNEVNLFVTSKKSTAIKYCKKFNSMLDKWYKYYAKYEDRRYGYGWISDKYVDKYYNRWYQLRETNKAYYEAINIR